MAYQHNGLFAAMLVLSIQVLFNRDYYSGDNFEFQYGHEKTFLCRRKQGYESIVK